MILYRTNEKKVPHKIFENYMNGHNRSPQVPLTVAVLLKRALENIIIPYITFEKTQFSLGVAVMAENPIFFFTVRKI